MRASAWTMLAVACLAGCATPETPARAEGPTEPEAADRLLGDLGGVRPALDSVGMTFDVDYTVEAMRVVDGGVRRTSELLGNLDVQLAADLGETVGWRGARAFAWAIANHGGNPSEAVGDLQAVSNIAAPESIRIHEAWLEQRAESGRVSGLIGLYDVNTEFDVMPAAGLFVHSSHGIGAEIGNSGRNGPSSFPATSLAGRLEVRPTDGSFVRAVVADGVPGDPRSPRRTSVRFDDGVYALAEQPLFRETVDPAQGLTAFLRAGLADRHVHVIDRYLGAGLVYRGLVHGRGDDELGLAVAAARFGSDYQRASGGTSGWEDWEVAIELTYRAEVTPWWSVQPDLQFVVHPGGDPQVDDALVLGVRTMVSF